MIGKCHDVFMKQLSLNNYFDPIFKCIISHAGTGELNPRVILNKYKPCRASYNEEIIAYSLQNIPLAAAIKTGLRFVLKKGIGRIGECMKNMATRIRQAVGTGAGDSTL